MKKSKNLASLHLVFAGSLLLIVSYLLGLSHHNWLLLAAWLMVTGGIILHVISLKRKSRY